MNNEPVAWVNSLTAMMEESFEVYKTKQVGFDMPLYTHPAKTLTDEEILIEAKYQPNLGYYLACEYDVLDFARAILRKAQEKC
jgi:hypothetical protein